MKKYEIEKDWTTAAGLRAVVIMTDLGHRCGYVGVPEDHPLFGLGYSEETDRLQGISEDTELGKRGILPMFCAASTGKRSSPDLVFDVHGSLTYSGGKDNYPVESNLWWFGYDCGHAGDAPAPGSRMAQYRIDTDSVHRTLDYCINECESLAKQIITLTIIEPQSVIDNHPGF